MLYASERGGVRRDKDEDTDKVMDGIECWQHHGFRVRHFLLKLEDCRVDSLKDQTRKRNDDETPLY